MELTTTAGWGIALGMLIAASLAAPVSGRSWVVRATALLVLYLVALIVAEWLLPATAAVWAIVFAPAAVVLAVQPSLAVAVLAPKEIGLRAPHPGSTRVVLLAIGLALTLNVAAMIWRGPAPVPLASTVVVAVLLAAVLEELVFRGVLLGLLDRAFPPRWQVLGAPIGSGGVVLTIAFVALHGVRPGMLLGVVPAALLYLWLRARTGSLLAPIVAHLAWNLSVVLVH